MQLLFVFVHIHSYGFRFMRMRYLRISLKYIRNVTLTSIHGRDKIITTRTHAYYSAYQWNFSRVKFNLLYLLTYLQISTTCDIFYIFNLFNQKYCGFEYWKTIRIYKWYSISIYSLYEYNIFSLWICFLLHISW